jgi:hypothetical protein
MMGIESKNLLTIGLDMSATQKAFEEEDINCQTNSVVRMSKISQRRKLDEAEGKIGRRGGHDFYP